MLTNEEGFLCVLYDIYSQYFMRTLYAYTLCLLLHNYSHPVALFYFSTFLEHAKNILNFRPTFPLNF